MTLKEILMPWTTNNPFWFVASTFIAFGLILAIITAGILTFEAMFPPNLDQDTATVEPVSFIHPQPEIVCGHPRLGCLITWPDGSTQLVDYEAYK